MDGQGLKIIRKRLRLTQAEMAIEMKVSRQSYIAWEKDIYKMTQEKIDAAIALDKSIPDGGIDPKETAKQRDKRLADEAHMIRNWQRVYRGTRAFCKNHRETMREFARTGSVIPSYAFAAIVEEWPDILADPDGNNALTKEQANAALGLKL